MYLRTYVPRDVLIISGKEEEEGMYHQPSSAQPNLVQP